MANKNEKRSFVMYDSFWEAMKYLNDAEFRECVLRIRDYALDGVDEESSSPMVNVIMVMAKPTSTRQDGGIWRVLRMVRRVLNTAS